MGQGEHSDKLGNNKDKTMNVNQILTAVGVVVAIAAVFVGQLAAYSALILVVLGLVSGFMNPTADMAGRMAYTVAAVAMPTVANQLDAIPAVGAPLNSIIDNIAVMIAGMVVANFLLAVKDSVMASGEYPHCAPRPCRGVFFTTSPLLLHPNFPAKNSLATTAREASSPHL